MARPDNPPDATAYSVPPVTGWLLAGGEGRRMNGRDKGLVPYHGRPLATWVLDTLIPQTAAVQISANRHLDQYAALLRAGRIRHGCPAGHADVWPDDADLPPRSGPLAGFITAMRHTQTDWLMLLPCDTPQLPNDLVARMLAAALESGAQVVVPCSGVGSEQHYHWVCALLNKRENPEVERAFVKGERKVSRIIQSLNWTSVSFPDAAAFTNMNTLETPNGRD